MTDDWRTFIVVISSLIEPQLLRLNSFQGKWHLNKIDQFNSIQKIHPS
jgi:hypothetical protein